MSDRDAVMAVYKAIEKLYFAVTGSPLTIDVPTEKGTVRIIGAEAPATLA